MPADTIRQALFAGLRHRPGSSAREAIGALDGAGWVALVELARQQRVVGLLYHRIVARGIRPNIPPAAVESFERASAEVGHHVLRLHGELTIVLREFEALAIPVILLKGAHLATGIYRNVALRDMSDLDLLIPEAHLEAATSAILRLGYQAARPYRIEVDRATFRHLVRCVKPGISAVEVHWNLTNPGWPKSIEPAGLWVRAQPVRVAGVAAQALSVEDTILHLCLHTAYQHLFGFGIRSLCDIAAVTHAPGITVDWSVVQERAAAWQWQRGVYLNLRLARERLDADIPAEVLDALRPPAFDPALLRLAEHQLFQAPTSDPAMLGAISRMMARQPLGTRIRHAWRRLFVSRAELAFRVNRPLQMSRSQQIGWYVVRIGRLTRRHWRTVGKFLHERDSPSVEAADTQEALRIWLEADA